MRFLLDECVSARLTGLLVDAGHDCVHARDRELLGAPDEDVMAAAVAESRVLISMDTDFGELLATSNASLPSVVLFRRVARTAEEQAAVLLLNLADTADDPSRRMPTSPAGSTRSRPPACTAKPSAANDLQTFVIGGTHAADLR